MSRGMRSASACLVGVALMALCGCAEDSHTSSAIVAQGVSVHHSATFWESEPSPSPEPTVTDASGVTTPSHTPPASDTAADNDSPSLPKAMTAAERQFAWAESPELSNGYTVVLVQGEAPGQVLQILAPHHVGPIRSGAETVLAAQAAEGDITSSEPYYTTILAGTLPNGWTVAIEDDGYQATVDGRAARLSAGGTEVAVFWNINLDAQFDYARSGVLLRSFDPIAYQTNVGAPLPQESGIHFGNEKDWAALAQSMLLAYRLTGVRLSLDDVTTTTNRIGVVVEY